MCNVAVSYININEESAEFYKEMRSVVFVTGDLFTLTCAFISHLFWWLRIINVWKLVSVFTLERWKYLKAKKQFWSQSAFCLQNEHSDASARLIKIIGQGSCVLLFLEYTACYFMSALKYWHLVREVKRLWRLEFYLWTNMALNKIFEETGQEYSPIMQDDPGKAIAWHGLQFKMTSSYH